MVIVALSGTVFLLSCEVASYYVPTFLLSKDPPTHVLVPSTAVAQRGYLEWNKA